MDCAILSLKAALEKVNDPQTLVALRQEHPNVSEEVLLENLAQSRSEYEQAIQILQACNELTKRDDDEEGEEEVEVIVSRASQNKPPPPGEWN